MEKNEIDPTVPDADAIIISDNSRNGKRDQTLFILFISLMFH
jgi:hypothetical protein